MTDPRKYVGYKPSPEEMVMIPEEQQPDGLHAHDDDSAYTESSNKASKNTTKSSQKKEEDERVMIPEYPYPVSHFHIDEDETIHVQDDDSPSKKPAKSPKKEEEPEEDDDEDEQDELAEDEDNNDEERIHYTPEYMSREELADFYSEEIDDIIDQEITKIINEQVEQIVTAKSKEVIELARQEAYQVALQKRRGEIAQSIKNVDSKLEEIQKLHLDFLKKSAFELKFLAVDIAQKFVLTKLESNDTLLESLVVNTVANIKNTSWLDVEVSETLVSLIEVLKDQLHSGDTSGGRVTTITPKPCAIDTVRVNTEEGTVVSTISTQADNLRTYYEEMDKEQD